MPSGDCPKTSQMNSQHKSRWWLGAVRQQTITWASVDSDQYGHMVSVGHAELEANVDRYTVWYKTKFGSQNLATKFGNHLCIATKIGSQC